jgi:hypothetical protein
MSVEILEAGTSSFSERNPVMAVGPDGEERLEPMPDHPL